MKRRGGFWVLLGTLVIMLACLAVACQPEEETVADPGTPTPQLTQTPAPTLPPAQAETATAAGEASDPTGLLTPDRSAPAETTGSVPTDKPGVTAKPTATKSTATAKPSTVPIGTAITTTAPTAVATVTPTPEPAQQYPTPVFDTSTAKDGYITIRYTKAQDVKYKVRLELNGTYENYTLQGSGAVETFPVKLGTGTYKVLVLENIGGTSYRIIASESFTVESASEFGPYLKPNPHVNYTDGMACIAFSKTLVSGLSTDAQKAQAIYSWVVSNISYDYSLVGTLPAGYLPNPENTYNSRKGICYDFASLLAAMCRANGIPAKLIIGTADGIDGLHAWNNVYFDGDWHRYDASSASQGGSGSNYQWQAVY